MYRFVYLIALILFFEVNPSLLTHIICLYNIVKRIKESKVDLLQY